MAPIKRKSIDKNVKLDVIKRVRSGESLHSVSRSTGFQRCQIRKWVSKESQLLDCPTKSKRVSGGGKKPQFPEIESEVMAWFKQQRKGKLIVSYNMLRLKANKIANEKGFENFRCSDHWIRNVCRRHKISSRKVTHTSQQQTESDEELLNKVQNYLSVVRQKTTAISLDNIYNMDETPCFFDMTYGRTLHFVGDKTVDGLDTGHTKNRFTVVLCVSADGKFIRSLLIFKGLKNVPKLKIPKNLDVAVSQGGSMNIELMNRWILNCYKRRKGPFSNSKSVLIMDGYAAHTNDEIIKKLKKTCNTDAIILPSKTTSFLQPLDVSINKVFKSAMRVAWNNWFENGPEEYTSKGYRKKPSYQNLVDFVDQALTHISPDIIKRSFECCGISAFGGNIPIERYNKRFQDVLKYDKSVEPDDRLLVEEDDVDNDLIGEEYIPDEEIDSTDDGTETSESEIE